MRSLEPGNLGKFAVGRKVGTSVAQFQNLWMYLDFGNNFVEAEDFRQCADRLCGLKMESQHPLLRIFANKMFVARQDDATDPRDKVFALLVLTKQITDNNRIQGLPLEIHYTKSTEDVYRETFTWIINESGCLGILCLLQPDRLTPEHDSFVPDLRCPPIQALRLFSPDELYRTNALWRSEEASLRPFFKSRTLHAFAEKIGTINAIGDSGTFVTWDGCFEQTAELLLNSPLTVPPHNLNRIDIWHRTLCGDDSPPTAPTLDNDGSNTSRAAFKEWLIWLILRKIGTDYHAGRISRGREHQERNMPTFETLAQADETVPKMLPDLAFWMSMNEHPELQQRYLTVHKPRFKTIEIGGRRLFRFNNDRWCMLGLGPEGMKVGDEVCVVAGCVMPVVLRRRSGEGSSLVDDGVRVVVGEAYVNGLAEMLLSDFLPGDWSCFCFA